MLIYGLTFMAGFVTGGVMVYVLLTVFANVLQKFFNDYTPL